MIKLFAVLSLLTLFNTHLVKASELSLTILSPEKRKKAIARPSLKKVQREVKRSASINYNPEIMRALETLDLQGKKINEALGLIQNRPAIWDFTSQLNFVTGTVLRGVLINSVVSSNLESPLIVKIIPHQGLPEGTRVSCQGITKLRRIMVACNRLIIPEVNDELSIKTSLLNVDGSSGLRPDEIYTGKEEYVAASVAKDFAQGMIGSQLGKLANPLNPFANNPSTTQSILNNEMLNSAGEVSDVMKQDMQSKESKAYIKAGREVLIYFHERFVR